MKKLLLLFLVIPLISCKKNNTKDKEKIETTGIWNVYEYKDEFDESTGIYFAAKSENGKFSNSATTNSILTAYIMVEEFDAKIKLFEYDRFLVKDEGEIRFRIKDSNGDITNIRFYNDKTSGSITPIEDADKEKFRELLEKEGELKFSREVLNHTQSEYKFVINTENLTQALEEVKMKNREALFKKP